MDSKISLCENNECIYVLTLLGGHLSMTLTLICRSKMSSYFLWHTLYVGHVISNRYSSFTRFSFHTLDILYLGDDVIMLPQHWTPNLCEKIRRCVTTYNSLKVKPHGGSEMQLDMFKHFYLVLGTSLGFSICNVIFQIWHFSILPLHT